ncbi:hypothetical protein SAMN04487895_1027 [Paenibacillus sophorae]|uniref:Lipoprotein n=1 Tax=Paenibacillus sophorae TaxID=1333845 RepID=A0A1H8HXY7_9BACL|nr:hypothetical protein [Paenibacillus sophorae]QWU15791.1 hypothetical protein KP014_00430 [Paenibacillus sophorae]SEN61073.1 hypothetical protein SAMN04487895_1027 [Paenibacillus sophorae]
MKTRQKFLTAAAVCLTLLLSACGKDGQETSASSFSSVQNTSVSAEEQDNSQVNEDRKAAGDSAAGGDSSSPEVSPAASPSPGAATAAIPSAEPSPGSITAVTGSAAPSPASSALASPDTKPTPIPKAEASASETKSAKATPSSGGQKAIASSKPAVLPAQSAEAKPSGSNRKASASAAPSPTRKPVSASPSPSAYADNGSKTEVAASVAPPNAGGETAAKSSDDGNPSGTVKIGWSEFFDGGDQTRPSERFWDLSESKSKVTIKGFMGEVLSFEKHWFLLIPQPGAECPFDNGDETYWNKIMIVFVPDDIKLRHKSGPLQVTGRLEVGIKIDESGYKTMFRLYDASFEEIKE